MSRSPQFRCQEYGFELIGDARVVQDLDRLFVDLAVPRNTRPHRWQIDTFGAHARIRIDDAAPGEWVHYDQIRPEAISRLTMEVIEAEPTKLHLHAGGVVEEGTTVLLVAPSGSGKSTLTCALVAAGARYRTDEVVAVERGGRRVTSYPKPISVKAPAIRSVERLTGLSCAPGAASWEIPGSAVGGLATDEAPVATIVFNAYTPGRTTVIEPLHRATAVRLALADSQDAARLGSVALLTLAELTRSARCLRVAGGDAAEMAAAIRRAHRQPVVAGEVAIVGTAGHARGPARGPGIDSVVVDGRAVLFTAAPHRIVELDEIQTLWWVLLDGRDLDVIVDDLARDVGAPRMEVAAAGRTIVEGLGALGVLVGS